MKSSIKFFALLGAVILSAVFVTGCSHSEPTPPPPAPEPIRPNS